MLFISHRANINGPNRETENTEDAIKKAITLGFHCEIDVWFLDGKLYLGHDFPKDKTSIDFLRIYKPYLWIHCKHIDSLLELKNDFNCFFHDKDLYTLTSNGDIWGNINSPVIESGIIVMPEKSNVFSFNCSGICSDYILHYKTIFESLNRP